MGILRWDLGDISGSEAYFVAAARVFAEAGDRRSHEFCGKCLDLIQFYNLGKNDRIAKLYHRSVQRFEDASTLAREIGFPDLQLKCLRQQALTYLGMRKLELFLENNVTGLVIAKALKHSLEQGRCLNNIGVYYQQQNSHSQAVDYLEDALPLIQRAGDQVTAAECLNNLGLVYRELGNPRRAQFYLSQALELDQKMGDRNAILMDLENIGSVLLRMGVDEKSEPFLREAFEAFSRCLSLQDRGGPDPLISFTALNNIGVILNELKDHDGARWHFQRAMKIVESDDYVLERSHVLSNLAASYLEEQSVEEALAHYHLAFENSAKKLSETAVIESCVGLGLCYEQKREPGLALTFYRKAIETMENMRARISPEIFMIGFARNKFAAYERAIDILADRYISQPSSEKLEEIFDLMERIKARAFMESVYEAQLDIAASDLLLLKERLTAISRNIDELTMSLVDRPVSAEDERALKNELEREEEEYVRIVSEVKAGEQTRGDRWRTDLRPIGDIQQQILADDEVILEYHLGESRSYLLVISRERVTFHILPATGTIERSLRAYLKSISDRSIDPQLVRNAAERIGRELIPLDETSLKQCKAMIVIPDGILHALPFEALRLRDEAGSRYLVEDLAVSYCPSASALALLKSPQHRGPWKKDVLAIGGADYEARNLSAGKMPLARRASLGRMPGEDEIKLSPLPFSKKEVRDIAKLYPKDRIDILSGGEADEDNVKKLHLRDYRIIHFACHALFNKRYPFRSALVLSQNRGTENDGLLQMREIYALAMTAELVVLSACQTGQGRLEKAEGSIGLARPFFFTGARSVIASLWPISDRTTVTFMREFYSGFIKGRSAADALRQAKKRMLESAWSHPYYWAAFMLQGDASVSGTMD